MSAKVSKFKRAYTLADTRRGPLGGVGRRRVLVCALCASGFEVGMKVQEFRDFQHPGTNTHSYTYEDLPDSPSDNFDRPWKTIPRHDCKQRPWQDKT